MKLLKEITEKDAGVYTNTKVGVFELRKAARSIVFNEKGQIALLYVSKYNYHKLPGGGIEEGENISTALNREILEEVGANTEKLGDIGVIIEYRKKYEPFLIHISYCYYSKVVGKLKETSFTDSELENGFELKWVDFDQAIELLEKDNPDNYHGKFIRERDLTFLKETKKTQTCKK